MTTKIWAGRSIVNYQVGEPQDWTPEGVPKHGDNLQMITGVMNLDHSNLWGNELHLGDGLPNTNSPPNAGAITINLLGGADLKADAVGGGLSFGDTLTITSYYSPNHLTADNLTAIDGTVHVGAGSELVVTGKMTFAYTGHLTADTDSHATGTITNNGTISIADGDISAHVNGHGTLELHNYHDGTGSQTISGAIDKGQTVVLVAHQHDTVTSLIHPETFKASLQIADLGQHDAANSFLELYGVNANRMDIKGDMLRLYGAGNQPVWQDHVEMPAGYTASMVNVKGAIQIEFVPHPLVG